MKHLLNKFLQNLKKHLPIILIIALALFLRLYSFEKRVAFDADQEEFAFKAKEILSGNLALLGPKTSLGGFSIGPGFAYLWTIFSFFLRGDPISGAYLSVFLGVSFIAGVYLVTKKIFSERIGLSLACVLALSISFIQWDQSPWAPSIFYISELIVFYGVYISNKNKWGLPLIAVGLGLGFQSHFAIFLLILPITIYLIIYKPVIKSRQLILFIAITLLSISPVIIYDLLHGFVNFQRLLSIFYLGVGESGDLKLKILSTLVSDSVNILWFYFALYIRYVIFIIVIIFSLLGIKKDKKYRSLLILSYLFLFIPFLTFLFYKSNFSEYYLMTVVIPFLILLGYVFSNIRSKYLLLIFLITISLLNMKSFISSRKSMNLSAKKQIVQEIIKKGGNSGYGVSISVQPGYSFGYSYLFDYYHATPNIPPLKNQKKIFTIISPPGFEGIEPIIEIDGVGLRWEGLN
jgi:4-amino-4-deoxy-L-arabinose transferase-like glycosyltransferase